ncbi:MAG: mycobacterial-type methylenetetrahydrofolate reductase, partial [Mycobacterium sp.]
MTLNTIALELVPPNADRGAEQVIDDAHKVLQLAAKCGIEGRIGHLMMPGLIAEEDDRP